MRRRVSRDRANVDLTDVTANSRYAGTADSTAVDCSNNGARLRIMRRPSSHNGSASRQSNNGDNKVGAPVSQSAAFTEFKIMRTPDELA